MSLVTTSMFLLDLLTLNIPTGPTDGEMVTRSIAEAKLKNDLLRNNHFDEMPNKTLPVRVYPMLVIDHMHEVDQDAGTMTMAISMHFRWMDERLSWDPKKYGGIRTLSSHQHDEMKTDIWTPSIHMTDLPGSSRHNSIFQNYDREFYVTNDGTVRSIVKAVIKMSCYFAFGDYPHDSQECSFTLMTPYDANVFAFDVVGNSSWHPHNQGNRVQDFKLVTVDTKSYYMYLGLKVVEVKDIAKYKASHCRSYMRFNVILQRKNALVFAQLTVPQMTICMIVGSSAVLSNQFAIGILVSTFGIQFLHVITMVQVLPSDFNGMPPIGKVAFVMMVEIAALVVYRLFYMQVAKGEIFVPKNAPVVNGVKQHALLEMLHKIDKGVKYVLMFQALANMYYLYQH